MSRPHITNTFCLYGFQEQPSGIRYPALRYQALKVPSQHRRWSEV